MDVSAPDAGLRRVSATRLLPAALAALVIAATAPVVALGWYTTRDGSERFLRDRAEIVVSDVADRVAAQLGSAETLGRHVSCAVAEGRFAVDDPAARPREAELTLLFLDLEGYSAFARGRAAHEVSAYLDQVLGIAGLAIEDAGGTIDKFTGDGLLAFWGAPEDRPDHARAAVAAALALVAPLCAGHAARLRAGLPACRIRIGLHTGRVVVGDVGYAGRVNYTALGGAVNVAARVQAALRGLETDLPVAIAATAATLAAAGPIDSVQGRPLTADSELGSVLRLVQAR